MPHASRLQTCQVLDGCVEQLIVGVGHEFIVSGEGLFGEHFYEAIQQWTKPADLFNNVRRRPE